MQQYFERIGKFFREVRAELRKVIWPNRRESTLYTSVVVGAVLVVAALIFVIDQALSHGLTPLFRR